MTFYDDGVNTEEKRHVSFLVHAQPVPPTEEQLERGDNRTNYIDVINVQVRSSKNDIACVPVTERHKRMFAPEWQAFTQTDQYAEFMAQEQGEEAPVMTSLENVSGVGPSKLKQLNDVGIRSAEALANCDPSKIDHIQFYPSLIKSAQALIGEAEEA